MCAVEISPFCREVLLRRQLDGCLPRFPIWDDVRTFDGRPWRGTVDVVSGGFPCQDISPAGTRRGITGERSKLWFEMSRIVAEVRPAFVFAENHPHLRTKGLGFVVYELTGMGYECRWGVLGARHVGAPHKQRNRIWIAAANADGVGVREQSGRRCGEGWTEEAELALSTPDANCQRELQQERVDRQERGWIGNSIAADIDGLVCTTQRRTEPAEDEILPTVEFGTADAHVQRCEKQRRPFSVAEEVFSAVECNPPDYPVLGRGKERESDVGERGSRRSQTWWAAEPDVVRVVHGCSAKLDKC